MKALNRMLGDMKELGERVHESCKVDFLKKNLCTKAVEDMVDSTDVLQYFGFGMDANALPQLDE